MVLYFTTLTVTSTKSSALMDVRLNTTRRPPVKPFYWMSSRPIYSRGYFYATGSAVMLPEDYLADSLSIASL